MKIITYRLMKPLLCLSMVLLMICSFSEAKALEFIKGGDVTNLLMLERQGVVFKDEKGLPRKGGALEIMKENGINCVRIHLWHTPENEGRDYADLDYVKELAQKAKGLDMMFLLDIMYSDDWANPGKQNKPKAWKDLSYEDLKKAVYNYGANVVKELDRVGACPDIIQCGNEVSWTFLENENLGDPNSTYYELLEVAIAGCKSAVPKGKQVRFMHHVHGINEAMWRFDKVSRSVIWNDIDILGMSYYLMFDHGDPNLILRDLNELASTFADKEFMIVEIGFPHVKSKKVQKEAHFEDWEVYGGVSKEGQANFAKFMVKTAKEVKDGSCIGICWFNAVGGHGHGSALFDSENGNVALLALKAFQDVK